MEPKPADDPVPDRHIEQLLERFAVDPADTPRFETLEEHFFLSGQWSRLAGVYECRISALEPGSPEWAELHVRLGRVLDERLDSPDTARRHYHTLIRALPRHADGLASLRRLLTRGGDLTGALQLAEIEEALALPPATQASRLAEIGNLWLAIGDREEARARFERAATVDAGSTEALAGLARLATDEGRPEEAIGLLERRIESASGLARVDAMEELVKTLPGSQSERVRTLLREIVREDPTRTEAMERLAELEAASGEWARADALQLRLYELTLDRESRTRLALSAATLRLDEAGDPDGALAWTERALRLAGEEDPRVHELRCRIFRKQRDDAALIGALSELDRLQGTSSLRALEAAAVHMRHERHELAVELLRALADAEPENDEALELWDECLARLGWNEERSDALRRRIARSTSSREYADLSCELGRVLEARTGEVPAAEDAYRAALTRVPGHGTASAALRELLRKQDRSDDLLQLFRETAAGAETPTLRAAAWCEVGELSLELEDFHAAREAFGSGLEHEPGNALALAGLRRLAQLTDDPSPRLEACEHELATEPSADRARALLREMIEVSLAADDLPDARRAAVRWTALEATAESFGARVELERAAGDPIGERMALEDLEALLRDEPEARAGALARLGELALEQADPDALETAAHWFRVSLEQRDVCEVRRKLISVYRRAGHLPELAHELEVELGTRTRRRAAALRGEGSDEERAAALEIDASEIELRVELARATIELGNPTRAIEALDPAFAMSPAHEEVADLLEHLLAEQHKVDVLAHVLERRLSEERDPSRRREIAHRRAALLLDDLEQPREAIELLVEFADPSRDDQLEAFYARALGAAGRPDEQERWLAMRESHVDGAVRRDLLLRMAALQRADERLEEAITTLRRAESLIPDDEFELVQRPLLALVDAAGTPDEKCDLLLRLRDTVSDARAKAAFSLERARLLIEIGGRDDDARAELETLRDMRELRSGELHLLASLCARAGATQDRLEVLERLANTGNEPEERARVLLELAELLQEDETRDDERAGACLRQVLDHEPGHPRAYQLLADLYRRTAQTAALEALVSERLQRDDLGRAERAALSLQQARTQLDIGEVGHARRTLEAARAHGASTPALDQLLYRVLELERDLPARLALCEECALDENATERAPWLRRWLRLLEDAGEPSSCRLEVVDRLLRLQPDAHDLLELRTTLVRENGVPAEIAQAIERLLGAHGVPPARRRVLLRELIRLCEGPLDTPARVLARLEAEIDSDPDLLPHAVRLASRADDPGREADLLLRWFEARPDELGATRIRALGLALARSGRAREAEPVLWSALEHRPHDREVLLAVDEIAKSGDAGRSADPREHLRLLEARFALEALDEKPEIAQQGFELCEMAGNDKGSLRWLQRWHLTGDPGEAALARRLELERIVGTPAGALSALARLAKSATGGVARGVLLAEEAELRVRRGELELARERYAAAVAACDIPEPGWLEGQAAVLAALGRSAEQADVLDRLSHHPSLDSTSRARHQDARIELLAAHPDLREQAVAALEAVLADDPDRASEAYRQRAFRLLRLYAALERDARWCELAEGLEGITPDERLALDRELARRLTGPLAARRRGVRAWRRVLERVPEDPEALRELAGALRVPGDEAELADVLELRARTLAEPGASRSNEKGSNEKGPSAKDLADLLLEAADLRWHALGDAVGAFAAIERALESGAPDEQSPASNFTALHRLRVEICGHLGRRADEAISLRCLLEVEPGTDALGERWLRLAQLLLDHEPSWLEAQRAAERALELAAEPRAIRAEVREVFERVGHFEHAAKLLSEEIADAAADSDQHGRLETLLRRRARIVWEELGDAAEACAVFEQLAQRATLSAADRERFAEALEASDRFAPALEQRRLGLEALGDLASAESWLELARRALDQEEDNTALGALDQSLALEPRNEAARELRADLYGERGEFGRQVADLEALGSAREGGAAAETLSTAANVAAERADDSLRAWELYLAALAADPSHGPALLGAGRIAYEREEWAHAERFLGRACGLLEAEGAASDVAHVAGLAAEAAVRIGQNPEAFRYLELALEYDAENAEVLDRAARLSAQMGMYQRARECLETRLRADDLDDDARAEREERLARACQELGDLPAAARALENVVERRGTDEVARANLIDLLERLGEPDRALTQLDAWSEHAPTDQRVRLGLRAARLEIATERDVAARERLEGLLSCGERSAELCVELAEVCLRTDEPARALEITSRIEDATNDVERAALCWARSRAELSLGESGAAAKSALDTLQTDPSHTGAARLLAQNLGHAGDWRAAIRALETALDQGAPEASVEAELWEAIGRTYAGPLEDIERAERAYRRALAANPMHERAREALADVTAFDPSTHAESARLHRELLRGFASRPGSWRALSRMAEHAGRPDAWATAETILAVLGSGTEVPAGQLLARQDESAPGALRAASEMLQAFDEADALPRVMPIEQAELPPAIARRIEALVGRAWGFPDYMLRALWTRGADDGSQPDEELSRRLRKRVRRAAAELAELGPVEIDAWRAELLARATAQAVAADEIALEEALGALFDAWPETRDLAPDAARDRSAALQLCAPARALLLRIADATIADLGV